MARHMLHSGGEQSSGVLRTNRPSSPGSSKATARVPLLVVAQASAETDDLLESLVRRPDLALLRVANLNAAELALRVVPVRLVIVCPETDAELVSTLLEETDEIRPNTPVLVLRRRSESRLPAWRGPGIGVLRCPILPEVLSRSVDVALGLTHGNQRVAGGSAKGG